jgi:hypothetical protein
MAFVAGGVLVTAPEQLRPGRRRGLATTVMPAASV